MFLDDWSQSGTPVVDPTPRAALDMDVGVLRVRLPGGLAEQPRGERAAQHAAAHLPAQRGQVRVPLVRAQQGFEAVGVVVRAEVGQPGDPAGRGVQVGYGADVVTYDWNERERCYSAASPAVGSPSLPPSSVRWFIFFSGAK